MIAAVGGTDAHIRHRINDFAIAAAVVEAGGGLALMPRHTTDRRDHPELVLLPLAHPGLGRHIDCLARPENLERVNVTAVLTRIRTITHALAAES